MNERLSNALAELAEKFGTTVEHLWGVMLKQATISGIMSLSNILLILVAAFVYYKCAQRYLVRERAGQLSDTFTDEIASPLILVISGLIVMGFVCVGIPSNLYDAITAFLNPEFWALQQIRL